MTHYSNSSQSIYIYLDKVVYVSHFKWKSSSLWGFTYLLRGDSSCELGRGWSCSTLADLGLFPALLPCPPGVLLDAPLEGVQGGQEAAGEESKAWDIGVWCIDWWEWGKERDGRNNSIDRAGVIVRVSVELVTFRKLAT